MRKLERKFLSEKKWKKRMSRKIQVKNSELENSWKKISGVKNCSVKIGVKNCNFISQMEGRYCTEIIGGKKF